MRICPNCNHKGEDNMNFCPLCGSQMSYVQPTYEPQPTGFYPTPAPKKPHLALKIVSMSLSIYGAVMMTLGLLYTLIGLAEEGMAFGMSFAFALFSLPMSIVGLCLASKCRDAGDTSAFSRVGKILGIVGIILSAVSLFIGFCSLAAL